MDQQPPPAIPTVGEKMKIPQGPNTDLKTGIQTGEDDAKKASDKAEDKL